MGMPNKVAGAGAKRGSATLTSAATLVLGALLLVLLAILGPSRMLDGSVSIKSSQLQFDSPAPVSYGKLDAVARTFEDRSQTPKETVANVIKGATCFYYSLYVYYFDKDFIFSGPHSVMVRQR